MFLSLPPLSLSSSSSSRSSSAKRTDAMAVLGSKLLVLGFVLGFCLVSSLGELERFEESPKADGSLTFLVVGDWGRRGDYNQTEVAHQVTLRSFSLPPMSDFLHDLPCHLAFFFPHLLNKVIRTSVHMKHLISLFFSSYQIPSLYHKKRNVLSSDPPRR